MHCSLNLLLSLNAKSLWACLAHSISAYNLGTEPGRGGSVRRGTLQTKAVYPQRYFFKATGQLLYIPLWRNECCLLRCQETNKIQTIFTLTSWKLQASRVLPLSCVFANLDIFSGSSKHWRRTEVEAVKSQMSVNGQLVRFQSALSTISSAPSKQGIWEDKHFTSSIFIFIMITVGLLSFIGAKDI